MFIRHCVLYRNINATRYDTVKRTMPGAGRIHTLCLRTLKEKVCLHLYLLFFANGLPIQEGLDRVKC